ncbi:Major royal jelly protein [Gillisia sp. Hel1_33_143]|uniref:L-dopachrome tautomerase-related protein n=1 Tax=Gillisia sp. Hel1_33_143 TaxID=1336796 RepID=UPI00087BE2BC|nr:L-dopachrome tautomerase-related protein [Gillisia sp. Hel1_33_143]SDS19235.1 Major royal jelly protein [Gillisia sp. Hel1_33_143]
MKKIILLIGLISLAGCKSLSIPAPTDNEIENVASFSEQQVTGLSISDRGRMFANFPRWRKGVENSVVEVLENGSSNAYPNKSWNTWEVGSPAKDSVFIGVQSVLAFENDLYVLDTRNSLFQGVIDNPRIFVFDLENNNLKRTYILEDASFHKDSYINDLRIDKKKQKVYLTDSGHAGIIILDLKTGASNRVLNDHNSTLTETDHLIIDGKKWKNVIHSDGIALDTENNILYYHALTGYSLYAISTDLLVNGTSEEIEKGVKFIAKTSAPDGMILDKKGNLYLADLENHSIMKFNISSNLITVLAKGEKIRWADTFSIYQDELYFTNSRINEINGEITNMDFTIKKIKL